MTCSSILSVGCLVEVNMPGHASFNGRVIDDPDYQGDRLPVLASNKVWYVHPDFIAVLS